MIYSSNIFFMIPVVGKDFQWNGYMTFSLLSHPNKSCAWFRHNFLSYNSHYITHGTFIGLLSTFQRQDFDLAAFEAHLLQEPDKGTTAVPQETEFDSEMETDSEKVFPPRFVKEMKNYRVQEGANLNLGCRVEGFPKPVVSSFHCFLITLLLRTFLFWHACCDYHVKHCF